MRKSGAHWPSLRSLAAVFVLIVIVSVLLASCGPSLEERRAAAPDPQLVTVTDVREDTDFDDDEEHYVTLNRAEDGLMLGTFPVFDSDLWRQDDDQTLVALQGAQQREDAVCVRFEEAWNSGVTFVAAVVPQTDCGL